MKVEKYMKLVLELLRFLGIVFGLWISLTTLAQAIQNPKLTQTELFLLIPKSFVLEFNQLNP